MENKEAKKKMKTKVMDHEDRLRELGDLLKWKNIRIIGVLEEEKEKGADIAGSTQTQEQQN